MSSDFPRILSLLRKEKGISQKSAAAQLHISQALLSHYEKGIRECGLDFLIRCADFYGVSCDYLLGRTADRQGMMLSVEDIPGPDETGKENRSVSGILPLLNKKLIANSLNIIFDLLAKIGNKSLLGEISSYLMLAVYRAFRIIYSVSPKNQQDLFGIPQNIVSQYTSSAAQICEANSGAIAAGFALPGFEPVKKQVQKDMLISTETLNQDYPLYSSSLLNLIQTAENKISFKKPAKD